ncbi:MAG: insulinase family protein [Treponemataceae bacterium]|nr:insulinase family protein [Treponemataceae bacterium]
MAIGFWFSAGSRYESEGKHGISHFVEHMIFKGTKNLSCFEIACEFDKMGGYINAFTEREQLCLYCVIPSQYCIQAINIMKDMIYNSTFEAAEIEKERQVIQSEILSSLDDPEEVSLDAVISSIWKNNPISWSIAGSKDDVESLTREDLISWYEDYIRSGNMLVTLSGNFPEKETFQALNDFPDRERFDEKKKLELPDWNPQFNFIKAFFQQEQFFYLFPIKMPLSYKKNICYAILNAIIGDTMSSRLFQKLREESGYCYNVYSFFNVFSDCGFWAFYATSSKDNSLKVVQDMKRIVDDFFENDISEEEINFAKQHLCGEEIMASEDVEQRMKGLARSYFAGYESIEIETIIDMIQNTTHEQLREVLDEIKKSKENAFIVYGPPLRNSIENSIEQAVKNGN